MMTSPFLGCEIKCHQGVVGALRVRSLALAASSSLGGSNLRPRIDGYWRSSSQTSHSCRSLGSKRSRIQSPRKFIANTVAKMASPGNNAIQYAVPM